MKQQTLREQMMPSSWRQKEVAVRRTLWSLKTLKVVRGMTSMKALTAMAGMAYLLARRERHCLSMRWIQMKGSLVREVERGDEAEGGEEREAEAREDVVRGGALESDDEEERLLRVDTA
jgi:hypothetical protein